MDPLGSQWASLGVGGVLAGFIFWFYRQDRKDSLDRWERTTKAYADAIKELSRAIDGMRKA